MSEKEKRILILTDTDPIGLCDKAHAFQYDFCPFTGNGKKTCREVCGLGLPRSEAVERIAKAIYVDTWKRRTPLIRVTNWEYGFADNMKKKYRLAAEAALDALVEAKAPKS